MIERISSWLAPTAQDPDLRRRQYLLNLVLAGLAGPGFLFGLVMAILWALGRAPIVGALAGFGVQPFYLLAFWLSRRGRVRLAAYFPVAGVFVAMVASSYQLGVGHVALVGYAMVTLTAGILIGVGAALFFTLLSTLAYVLVALAQIAGHLPGPVAPESMFISNAVGLGLGLTVMVIFDWISNREIGRALDRERALSAKLKEQSAELEQRVAERTDALERRSTMLEAASQVVRKVVGIRDVRQFVDETIRLTSEQFGFYHTAIFIVDEAREYAVLDAASSEEGRRLLARGYQVRVGGPELVGDVADSGESRVVSNVTPAETTIQPGQDTASFDGFDLPDTRSRVALPLKVGDHVIGVLDVQSKEPAAFIEEDVALLQTMTDQIALAIENARLLGETQQALEELEATYGRYTQASWQEIAPGPGRSRGYRCQRLRVEPVHEEPPEARRAREVARPVVLPLEEGAGEEGPRTALAVPLRLREQVVGVLNLHMEGEAVPPETLALVEEVAGRLALALENARLLEESQRQAARERLVGEVTAHMRGSLDMETVLRTAVDEMYEALGLDELTIRLTAPEGNGDPSGDGAGGRRQSNDGEVQRP